MASVRAIKTVFLVIFPDISCLNFKSIRRSFLNVNMTNKNVWTKNHCKKKNGLLEGRVREN